MAFIKSHGLSSILGLALDGRQVDGVLLHRSNGSFRLERTFRFTLSLDPLTNGPELVGREIRNHLDEAGVRERKCAVCLPLSWVLALSCEIPDIPEADTAGFLQLEAEQNFPYAQADLMIAASQFAIPGAGRHALIAGVPRNHISILIQALQTAHLTPVGISVGTAAIKDAKQKADRLILGVRESSIEMIIRSNGGLAAMRTLEIGGEAEARDAALDADMIAREIRITLGQQPKAIRDSIKHIQLVGSKEVIDPLSKRIAPLAQSMGLVAERGGLDKIEGAEDAGSLSCGCLPAIGLASAYLLNGEVDY